MNKNTLLIALAVIIAIGAFAYIRMQPNNSTGNAMVEVQSPRLDEQQMVGKELFDANCAACHGENAAGRDGIAPPLIHDIYKPSHHADIAFVLAAQNGVRAHHWPFGNMPAIETVDEKDVLSIIEYIRALQVANGIE
ncbi:c-type cytochrome [Maritalea sp. S77]|uniref:c-type cytochrome n=1 Tax=Maritalea sp. S77 TaxID=3415125 RepID=UPI003C7BDC8A